MRYQALPVLAGLCLPLSPVIAPAGPPPPPPRNMPGDLKGRVRTRWLAPFVSVTDRAIGPSGTATVQWFTPQGQLDRELAGPGVDARPGFVSEGGTTVHAANGTCRVARGPGAPGGDDVPAFAGQAEGQGPPDAPARPGDDGCPAVRAIGP